MKNLLLPRHRRSLAAKLSKRTLLAFDFDGSLAPIGGRREQTAICRTTRRLLDRLTAVYPCVVISSRGRQDLLTRLDGISFREIFGNHGLEPTSRPEPFRREVQRWEPVLTERLAHCPGVEIEDKGLSVTIHYRRSARKSDTLAAIRGAAAELGRLRLVPGKLVIHLLPFDAPDKDATLRKVRRQLSCETALYVGDDETDEAVFDIQGEWLVGIRIGAARRSSAGYFIPKQRDIDALLDWLLRLRSGTTVNNQAIEAES